MIRRLPAALIVAVFTVGAALAEEEAHGHHEAESPWPNLFFSTVNLLIFIWVLNRFVFPAVRTWVRERRERVIQDLETAAAAKAEALQLKAEWEARLAHLDETVAEMRAQARQDAERERGQPQ